MDEDLSEPSPAAVIGAMVAMFDTGDLSRVDAVVHPDYHDHQGLRSGPINGQDGFRKVVATARSGFETLAVSAEDLIEAGDRVAVRLRWIGRSSSGDVEERETIDIIRTEGGRAIEHWGGKS